MFDIPLHFRAQVWEEVPSGRFAPNKRKVIPRKTGIKCEAIFLNGNRKGKICSE
jgi:hypothetical protein